MSRRGAIAWLAFLLAACFLVGVLFGGPVVARWFSPSAPLQHRLAPAKPEDLVKITIYHKTGRPTASGQRLCVGLHAAVSRGMEALLPLGSRVWVPERPSTAPDGLWVVADRTDQRLPGLVLDLSKPRNGENVTGNIILRGQS